MGVTLHPPLERSMHALETSYRFESGMTSVDPTRCPISDRSAPEGVIFDQGSKGSDTWSRDLGSPLPCLEGVRTRSHITPSERSTKSGGDPRSPFRVSV